MPETKRVGLKLRGNWLGCERPLSPPDKWPELLPVYADRPDPPNAFGVSNIIDLTKQDDGLYVAVFVDVNRKLRQDDTGALNACKLDVPDGLHWATHRGAELPPDWPSVLVTTNGDSFLIVFL